MNKELEIKIVIAEQDLIPAEIKIERDELALLASDIKTVSMAADNALAGQVVVQMRKHVKAIEEMRLTRTRPLLDAQKLLKSFYDNHSEKLNSEIVRLQRLGTNFIESENRRVSEEKKERQSKFQEAQTAQFSAANPVQEMISRRKVQNIIAEPEPEANRAKGQTMKQVLRYEVIDILELVKARPDLCKIEAKASAINAVCNPNLPVPGLKLWFENVGTYTTR